MGNSLASRENFLRLVDFFSAASTGLGEERIDFGRRTSAFFDEGAAMYRLGTCACETLEYWSSESLLSEGGYGR